MKKSRHLIIGSCLMTFSMLCFATSGLFIKLIGDQVSTSVTLFFRFFFNIVFLIPILIKDHTRVVKIHNFSKIIIRSVIGLMALACMFYAIKHIPLTDAILLNNTATLFIPLVVWVMTGIRTSIKIILSTCFGFLGVLLVLGPSSEIFSVFAMIGLASGLLGAIALVLTRDLSKTSSPLQIIFYYALVGTIVSLVFAAFQITHLSLNVWLYLCGVGTFGAFYQIFLTYALKLAKVRYLSALSFLSFLFAALFDWLVWQTIPSLQTSIGLFFVVIGSFLTICLGAEEERNTNGELTDHEKR